MLDVIKSLVETELGSKHTVLLMVAAEEISLPFT